MTLGPKSGEPSDIGDFAGVLMPTDGSEPPVVVGGHAVSLWSLDFICMRWFLADLAEQVANLELSGRTLVNLLGEVWELVKSPHAANASQLWGFDFSAVWPTDELKRCDDAKISRWLKHRQP